MTEILLGAAVLLLIVVLLHVRDARNEISALRMDQQDARRETQAALDALDLALRDAAGAQDDMSFGPTVRAFARAQTPKDP